MILISLVFKALFQKFADQVAFIMMETKLN
jgi:hypothetical protein